MPKSYALLIGLNQIDPNHYAGWNGNLLVCESDALNMQIFTKNYTNGTTLLSSQATRNNVIAEIKKAAKELESGDLFLIYYSGHGGNEIPDINRDEKGEMDEFDETWCLYDGQLIDDELFLLWHEFKEGVRIILISDSCFSGDIAKNLMELNGDTTTKFLPKNIGEKVYKNNKNYYKKILQNIENNLIKDFKSNAVSDKILATILQISSSQEGQVSRAQTKAFPNNSLFTAMLMHHWPSFTGDYRALIKLLKNKMPDYQTPQHQILGNFKLKILSQKPFEL